MRYWRTRSRMLRIALVAAAAGAAPSAGQSGISVVPVGTRVRLHLAERPRQMSGTLGQRAQDSILLARDLGHRPVVAEAGMQRVDVSMGTNRHLLLGAAAGAAVGFGIGWLTAA